MSFTIDKTPPRVTGVTSGAPVYTTPVTISFNKGTATLNGVPFASGTTVSASGTYSLVVTDAAGNSTSISFTLRSASSGDGGGNSAGGSGGESSGSGEGNKMAINMIDIQINNVVYKNFAIVSVKTVNGKKVTTVQLDETKIIKELSSLHDSPIIVIPVQNGSDRVVVLLNSQLAKALDDKNMTVEVQTDNASYTLTANQFDMDAIAKSLGSNTPLKFNIEIANVPDHKVDSIRNKLGKISLVSPAIEFKITASSGGKTIEINKFLHFVQRRIAIPDGFDPIKITTGVVVTEDGNIVPVPTRLVQENGKYYAVMYSLTNSVYTVIGNEKTFSDIQKHWAKTHIEKLASKLIVQGISETSFKPDNQITRAEFTAILVRSLGLHAVGSSADYADVQKSNWFYKAVTIAANNGLTAEGNSNRFNPNEQMSRQEAMVMIAKAMHLAGMDVAISDKEVTELLGAFKDLERLDFSAKPAAALNVKYGVIVGYNGLISPGNVITRAETSIIIQRFLEAAKLN
ncbi:hypothetical protein E0485_07780 [Paenibacillus albiflavus]|uniref:SLH domain-containing protein n=1 Tax=Paenibacillus albiflavus TaxID=2545760 RepID=A0A4R4EEF9_9BACL|nr:S-layer homology domain-containing protein [Paenibacillus albiflavus]TCZ67747.1 hypothetical protein E0485_24495 [Paenibacillus albiflavus]TCZ78396.1 hypothetical protein E0485_07780 [Paenibacillus albiflavus]